MSAAAGSAEGGVDDGVRNRAPRPGISANRVDMNMMQLLGVPECTLLG
jgi:hypothetical protein